jgi:imidazolonepropionase-like amidohydrolase
MTCSSSASCSRRATSSESSGRSRHVQPLKQDQIGTLEPGKLVDLVLMDGNPLPDIHDLLKVVTTMQG